MVDLDELEELARSVPGMLRANRVEPQQADSEPPSIAAALVELIARVKAREVERENELIALRARVCELERAARPVRVDAVCGIRDSRIDD